MGNYLEIRKSDGVVTNIIVWDGIADFGQNLSTHQYVSSTDAPQGVTWHWLFLNGEWIAPPVVEQTEETLD